MGWLSGILPGPEDAFGLGLVLVLIGGFLLANSVLLRHPRDLVAEHFGGPRARLASMRGVIFQRLQVHLGFLFLLVGFALEIYGHYGASGEAPGPHVFPLAWVVAILVAVVCLELGGWWLSHALFLRYVREHFRAHPPALEGDLGLARELGDLFGIQSEGNDSVQSYLARIRRRIGLPENGRAEAPRRPQVEITTDTEEGFV
jgi:hypothetical protein